MFLSSTLGPKHYGFSNMSSTSNNDSGTNRTDWNDLTTARQRLTKTLMHIRGPEPIERPDTRSDVEDSSTIENVIDSKKRVLKSLNQTTLLNELVTDGYLVKTHQGGGNPIVIDGNYDADRDNISAAPFGDTGSLESLAYQVLDRNGYSGSCLDSIDTSNTNVLIETVNSRLGKQVLFPKSEASEYEFTPDGLQATKAADFDVGDEGGED